MEQQITLKEMEKIIKEAGINEENLSKKEIENFYKSINDSRSTAEVEAGIDDEESNETLDDLPEMKNSEIVFKKNNSNAMENEENLSIGQDATKASIGYYDMPKSNEESLRILNHPMKYCNIQNSKTFLKADIELKSIMLYSYHTNMGRLRAELSRQSFFAVPLPKPIIINEVISSTYETEDSKETYVSRSGRLTKRKTYNEDEDSSDAFFNKKPKNTEYEWQSKAKPSNKTFKDSEIMPELPRIQSSENKVLSKTTPKAKKLTVAETIEKSSLFADITPKARKPLHFKSDLDSDSLSPRRSARSQDMFDKLKESNKKKQEEEKIRQLFEETLPKSEDEDKIQENEDVISIMDEEPVVRRRVIPPTYSIKRKPPTSKPKTNLNLQNRSTWSNEKDNDFESGFLSNQKKKQSLDLDAIEKDESNTQICPICSVFYPHDTILAHAATCGDVVNAPRFSRSQNLTCKFCEKVFLQNYEEHVTECKKEFDRTK